ncbi:DUF6415 family natural product biosynthesis protein [Streptomyces sp. B15]|uniref:DUF6415 family natural product biosynthesis protein n=1 Tax=Streptomyces sp. B15 TaxID=1537797 RepID=UPI001B367973|nr:DUF6415 family natural product biosynthesis protein [Streptomyces sp. B15]MBQ1119202.1 hypothetical protein [Streptomyces sp. B15]
MGTDTTSSLRTDVDTEDVNATISAALTERKALPRYEELCELHNKLVTHINALLPLAAKQIEALWHGSREWYLKRSSLDTIPYEVAQGLGTGLLTAEAHVRSLGYTLRFLLRNSGLAAADEEPEGANSSSATDV